MGMIFIEMKVGNPANPEITERTEFLVDSGAIYSVVPAPVLQRLGIRPMATQTFRLANGERISRQNGVAYNDRIGASDVIFGEPGDSNLLDTFTLDALALALDPLRRELRELPLILGGWGYNV